jgi:trehalose 6-phosphate phosphatase
VKYALSAVGLQRIEACATNDALLAFDIDGTLAPIAPRPKDARVPLEVQRGLRALSRVAPVAVITGRAVSDARPMLGFTPHYLIGNHGAEGVPGFEHTTAAFSRVCRHWLDALSASTEPWQALPGVTLEDKMCSLTFHFRHARDGRLAHRLLLERARKLDPVPRLFDGKDVLNLVPPGSPDKGDALLAILEHSHRRHALYIGDDVSDEAAFRLRSPTVLTMRVEHDSQSGAELYLKSQAEIPAFLRVVKRMLGRRHRLGGPAPRKRPRERTSRIPARLRRS